MGCGCGCGGRWNCCRGLEDDRRRRMGRGSGEWSPAWADKRAEECFGVIRTM